MTADYISDLAYQALVAEVDVTPKPGLVDKNNNGAHNDMSRELFLKSAISIKPYFASMCTEDADELKQIGIEAEREMYIATEGVNTHKGAIYSLGLLCASVYLTQSRDIRVICDKVSELSKHIDNDNLNTNGYKVFKEYGLKGAKGEAESGFINVREFALPVYERFVKTDGENIAAVKTLLSLIANVDDTNVVSRGGIDVAKNVKEKSAKILNNFSIEKVIDFDNELIDCNVSPGGCADLLAVTIFLFNLKTGD